MLNFVYSIALPSDVTMMDAISALRVEQSFVLLMEEADGARCRDANVEHETSDFARLMEVGNVAAIPVAPNPRWEGPICVPPTAAVSDASSLDAKSPRSPQQIFVFGMEEDERVRFQTVPR
jgi:hypothetical protein